MSEHNHSQSRLNGYSTRPAKRRLGEAVANPLRIYDERQVRALCKLYGVDYDKPNSLFAITHLFREKFQGWAINVSYQKMYSPLGHFYDVFKVRIVGRTAKIASRGVSHGG